MKRNNLLFTLAACLWLVSASGYRAVAEDNDALPALVQVLEQTDDLQFQLDVLKGMSEALKGRRDVPMPAGWDALASKLSHSPDPGVRELVQSLSVTFGSRGALDDLRRQLMNHQASLATRRKALEGLVAAKDAPLVPLLLQVFLGEPDLRAAALRALAVYDNTRTPAEILRVYPDLQAGEKADALHTLVSRAPYARTLLDRARAGTRGPEGSDGRYRSPAPLERPRHRRGSGKAVGPGDARRKNRRRSRNTRRCSKQRPVLRPVPPAAAPSSPGPASNATRSMAWARKGRARPDRLQSRRPGLSAAERPRSQCDHPNDYRTSTLETKDEHLLTALSTRGKQQRGHPGDRRDETVTVPRPEIESLIQGDIFHDARGFAGGFQRE